MSGGHFGRYVHFDIDDVATRLKHDLRKNGRVYDCLEGESPEVVEAVVVEIERGLAILNQAAIYFERIDWFLSGDDGAETFLERLKEGLAERRS